MEMERIIRKDKSFVVFAYELFNPKTEEWKKKARCAPYPKNVFFPERGEPSSYAKVICNLCPVKVECKEYGKTEGFGIWGGESTVVSKRRERALKNAQQQSNDYY